MYQPLPKELPIRAYNFSTVNMQNPDKFVQYDYSHDFKNVFAMYSHELNRFQYIPLLD
jgi:hypothetical protein